VGTTPLNAAWPNNAAEEFSSEAGPSCRQLIVQMATAHLPTISQQGQVFSVEDVDVAVRVPLSAIAACIDPMAFATATGDSTSAMLTTAESIDLKIGMRMSPVLVLTRCAALRYT
jgi:hypothetical protein